MRFPVFARRSNPAVDRPILRKSLNYVTEQVESGRAIWVDPLDPAKGIQCREVLYFGEREIRVETVDPSNLPLSEIPGLRFVGPVNPVPHFCSTLGVNAHWDWSQEVPA